MPNNIDDILFEHWGYRSFRPLQREIITAVLNGKDILALLPTGGGKSVCYQVPAMAMDGLCLVVSPLIALMQDQVQQLTKRQIPALMLYAGLKRHESEAILRKAGNGQYKFLFVSPERIETNLFKEYLPGLPVNLLAVDEAHCIAQWGHDFRPPYLRIAALREYLGKVPVLALTASATPAVQQEICERLAFREPEIFKSSFSRAELEYYALKSDAKINTALAILKKTTGSAIVYCNSRRKTREVADVLQMHKISAGFYHAGLKHEERNDRQQQWITGRTRVMVCTNAFGMGIDKPDVRTVIHYDTPDAPENYYQEAGRAGRDRQPARAVLLYQEGDITALRDGVALKFPPEETIKEIYLAIANYLQLPAGSGAGQFFPFDLDDFTRRFQHPVLLTANVLRLLMLEDYLEFNEAVLLPATVMVLAGRETLNDVETRFPELDELLKTLLRTYAGIIDQPVFIQEKKLAWLLRSDTEKIIAQLQRLQALGILEYTPVKDKPQLFFLRNRVAAEDFTINPVRYAERKERYIRRMEAMIAYILNAGNECRSHLLCVYFGETAGTDCGVCEVCRKKAKPAALPSANVVYEKVMDYIRTHAGITLSQLKEVFDGFGEEPVTNAVRLMLAEEKIAQQETGGLIVV